MGMIVITEEKAHKMNESLYEIKEAVHKLIECMSETTHESDHRGGGGYAGMYDNRSYYPHEIDERRRYSNMDNRGGGRGGRY